MKSIFLCMIAFLSLMQALAQNYPYDSYPVYEGRDLGLQYSPALSKFRVWAPTATAVELRLYEQGEGGSGDRRVSMQKSEGGTWTTLIDGDLKGRYYTYCAEINGVWMKEVPDPYSFATGINGKRSAIMSMDAARPSGWEKDQVPEGLAAVDAVIYELHIRDASIHASSGIHNKGKFLGLAETGTHNAAGLTTGLDHIRDLGITHVHLLPFFDYLSVDESKPDLPQYNWGYEPLNYNVPEGSYSTNAGDPAARIRELRQMVQTFHQNDLRVVMDVVYNHTMLTEDSWFNQLVPGYYYRQNGDGGFSNASACGNEIASDRPMVRKYILESLEFWMQQYHINGFRFDLMGIHDIETMKQVGDRLRKINPHVLLYGEGWTAGDSPLPEPQRALKKHAAQLNDIAVFSDDIRDGIKGSVFIEKEKGFVSGRPGMEPSIRFGVVASCRHPQVDYTQVNYSRAPYAEHPGQTVTYAECHDNHVLWDKLALSATEADEDTRKKMHQLALGIVLTSQGIPFLHAGTEFLRTKQGNENSYNAGDNINAIDWDLKTQNREVFDYVKALVALRRLHPAFRLRTGDQVREAVQFHASPAGMVAYTLNGELAGDEWSRILVVYNALPGTTSWVLPRGTWQQFLLPGQYHHSKVTRGRIHLTGPGCYIYFQIRK